MRCLISNGQSSTSPSFFHSITLPQLVSLSFQFVSLLSTSLYLSFPPLLSLFEASGIEENSLQYFSFEPGLADLFPLYLNKYLPLDPVCRAYRAASSLSDVAVQRVRPTDIPSPGFRRRFFDDPGIIERVSVIQRGEKAWRVMTVCRH